MYYPIKMNPVFKEMPWGGNRLETMYGKKIPSAHTGESWELSAIPGSESVAANGADAGKPLGAIISADPCGVLGRGADVRFGGEMPLLFKIIDANAALSVQVHPGDDYARLHENGLGKTEMWVVLDAEPGAGLYAGFSRPVTKEEYEQRIADNTLKEILNFIEVTPGDCVFLPAGMVHAIGEGLLIGEIQQSSATTYRVYDWGRVGLDGKPRQLHIEKAKDVSCLSMIGRAVRGIGDGAKTVLPSCPYFEGYQWTAKAGETDPVDTAGESFSVLFCASGSVSVAGGGETVELHAGETCLIPALCAAEVTAVSDSSVLCYRTPAENRTKTAIFDLDGTLLNTIDDLCDSMNRALVAHGYPTHTPEECLYFIGNGAKKFAERAMPADVQGDDALVEQVLATYKDEYAVHYLDKTAPYDGVREMLESLHKMGVKLCVLSNKPHDKTNEMTRHFFGDLPFAVINGGRVGVKLKPDAGAITEILDLIGADKAHTFYVGDSDVDMFTANNAGVFACAACWGFRPVEELRDAGADALCMTAYDALACAKFFFEGK